MGKFRILSPFFMALGLLAFSGTWAGPATAAEDCPRSFLDERYCDRDGNLTADLPVDEGEWVDPDTIIFSYTPVRSEERRVGKELSVLVDLGGSLFIKKKI